MIVSHLFLSSKFLGNLQTFTFVCSSEISLQLAAQHFLLVNRYFTRRYLPKKNLNFKTIIKMLICYVFGFFIKESHNSSFGVTPKNHQLICLSQKNIKNHCHKKVIVCFYNLGEENV